MGREKAIFDQLTYAAISQIFVLHKRRKFKLLLTKEIIFEYNLRFDLR